jgi:hypothetical protein
MSDNIFKFIDFKIEKSSGGEDRLYITHAQYPENTITIKGEIIKNNRHKERVGSIRVRVTNDEIPIFQKSFSEFFDLVLSAPSETYYEMVERRIKEGVNERLHGMGWFKRLFMRNQ